MRSGTPFARLTGGLLSHEIGGWTTRPVLMPCRGPSASAHVPSASDSAATSWRTVRTRACAVTSTHLAIGQHPDVTGQLGGQLPGIRGHAARAARAGTRKSGAKASSGDSASSSSGSAPVAGAAASPARSPPPPAPPPPAPATAPATPKKTRTRRAKTTTDPAQPASQSPTAVPASTAAPLAPPAAPPAAGSQAQPAAAARLAPVGAGGPRNGLLLVVDGNYLANRAYFGYSRMKLTTSAGVPTSITYGVLKTLQAAVRAVQPTALAVVFDPRGPTFRSAASLLDPSGLGPLAGAASRLVAQGRLDWQVLANRLLLSSPVQQEMAAAAAADATTTPASFLQPNGTFLPPPPPSALTPPTTPEAEAVLAVTVAAADAAAALARADARATAALAALLEALGPELAAAVGLVRADVVAAVAEGAAAEAAEPEAGAEALPLVLPAPLYKAGRTAHTAEFYTDFHNLQRLLGVMGMPPLIRPWLEADDLAGLLVHNAVQHGMSVRVLTGDRDLYQLVDDAADVALLYPAGAATSAKAAASASRSFPFATLREEDVVAGLGVPPAQVADYKALVGDESDRLPGVEGIGPKTAAQLLAKYGSLAGVHAALAELTPKRRAALQAAAASSQYTLALARVLGAPGAPTPPPGVLPTDPLSRFALRGFDPALVSPALRELEMHSLVRDAQRGGALWKAFGGSSA